MTISRSLVILCALFSLATISVAGAQDAYDAIVKRGSIRIANDTSSPPYGMLDAALERRGSDVETAKLLAKDWGLRLEWIDTAGPNRIPTLLTDKADVVVSGLSITDERRQVIEFSEPYARARAMIGAVKALPLRDIGDLKGRVVSLTRGSQYDNRLTAIAAEKGFTVRRYEDESTTITAGVSGQADVVANGETLIAQIIKRNPNFENKFELSGTDIAIGLRKGNPLLKAKLDEWVMTNIRNGKLAEIWEANHGVKLPERFTAR